MVPFWALYYYPSICSPLKGVILMTLATSHRSTTLSPLSDDILKDAWNQGVFFDSELSFDTKVTKVLQSCFVQLRHVSIFSRGLFKVTVVILFSFFLSTVFTTLFCHVASGMSGDMPRLILNGEYSEKKGMKYSLVSISFPVSVSIFPFSNSHSFH